MSTKIADLFTYYSAHPKILELLRDRALNDSDEQLREWAKEQLDKWDNIKDSDNNQ
ncbi:hypothetical protein HC928_08740 [bacterium]|nr:hypothetical protein [bacterium]